VILHEETGINKLLVQFIVHSVSLPYEAKLKSRAVRAVFTGLLSVVQN
jgi:hypothetical protein